MRRAVLLCLLGALALAATAAAQQDFLVQHWFAEHPTAEFVPGKPVPVVVGVRNTGGSPFNITAAVATLNHPLNASIVVYNFTAQPYHVPLQPGQELSLEYPIMMPPNLPARDFILQIGVWMSEGTAEEPSHQQHLFYNETINVVDEPTLVDFELLGLWLVGAAIVGVGFFFASESLRNLPFVKKAAKKSKKSAPKEAAPVDKDEWLKGTYYDQQKKKAAAQAAKKAE